MKMCILLVTCCLEAGRTFLMKETLQSLIRQKNWNQLEPDFFVFDNNSTVDGAKDFIKQNCRNVFESQKNYGYWSALNWFCNSEESKKYDYIYVVESDNVHFDEIEKLYPAMNLLELNSNLGMIRTQEFSVANKHLYDKQRPSANSRKSEWATLFNVFSNESAWFTQSSIPNFFETNMVAKVCGLHRIASLKRVLQELQGKYFYEVDFQREYFKDHKINLQMDGGLFSVALSATPEMLKKGGSYVGSADADGYKMTREGSIDRIEEMNVIGKNFL